MGRSIEYEKLTPAWAEAELQQLNELFRKRSPEALLEWAARRFGEKLVLTCSFGGPSGMVLLDMVARLGYETPIVFLDTGLLFPETYALAEAAAQRYGLTIEYRRPALTIEQQDRQEGPQLYARDPDRCCGIRKVAPLAEALRPYDAWMTGLRRDQSATRAGVELLQWSTRYELLKINPLAFWGEREIWSYIYTYDVPYNPLLDQGYRSLGCVPCTLAIDGGDPRAGRWVGFAKTECGIHLG
ncbi:MAG: phosphoadenosine phosphosulfate reductase [Herpetosiphonaceae bacterium]|nr:MAG: phosphoadenosine phosphosulfate reductase [Herpetosiphonaceae bacterium]